MTGIEILLAIVVAVGVVGTLVPVLPGSGLVAAAVVVWAWYVGTGTAWVVFAVAVTLLATGALVKYAVPGRRLRAAGVPTSTLVVGALAALVGFFVIPVVGLVVGFLAGTYAAEWRRLGDGAAAWAATVHAVKAVGLGVLIELVFALLAAATWAVGVVLT